MRILVFLSFLLLVASANAQPIVSVGYHTIPEKPSPGYFIISIDISNSGTDARNLGLLVQENEDGFYFIDNGEKKSILFLNLGDLSAGSTSVQIKAYAEKSGIYSVRVKLTYTNNSESYAINSIFGVLVYASPFIYTGDEISLKPGESRVVKLEIKNTGGGVESAVLSLISDYVTSKPVLIESWRGGETKTVYMTVSADRNAAEGVYEANLRLNYRSEFGESGVENVPVILRITPVPKISIRAHTIPEKIYVDSDFTLQLVLTSRNSNFNNLSVKLELPEGFEGESSKYIGRLDSGESVSTNLSLKAPKKSGNYRLSLVLSNGNMSQKYDIPIYVAEYGKISIDLAGVYTSPQEVHAGESFKLSIQLENSGKQDAKAVEIRLIFPEGLEGRDSYFIGTLESGDSATATFELKALADGNHEVKARISYMDQAFEVHEKERSFTVYVFSSNYTAEILAAVFILVVAGIAAYFKFGRK
ncbi:COG1361 S-layer family protein [Archaeoglobus neptunius]|uniref:COG1361 S-layer family protein n=1 Tax=Archaeoglobus neptunius TaxID=2798580 RepID=UPI001925C296|nr:COG1361 S-layer family protein [Archaeoglobus neptunius]